MSTLPGIIILTAKGGDRVRFNVSHIVNYGRQRGGYTILQDACDVNSEQGSGCTLVNESAKEIDDMIAEALPQAAELSVSEAARCCCCGEIQQLHQTLAEMRVELRNQ